MTQFRLDDGKPVWALAVTEIEGEETYLYTEEDLAQYPDHELLDPPTPEIVKIAESIEGLTLSKTEFAALIEAKLNEGPTQEDYLLDLDFRLSMIELGLS